MPIILQCRIAVLKKEEVLSKIMTHPMLINFVVDFSDNYSYFIVFKRERRRNEMRHLQNDTCLDQTQF